MSDPAFFLVASAGFSGSKWFAAALDRHPDILCTHSAGDFQIWDRRYSAEEFDRCTEEEWIHRAKKPLDDYLAQLAARGDAKVYGNVHRYRVCDIAELMRGQAPTTRFVIANLVRHPVLWTQSGARQFVTLAETNLFMRFELLHGAMSEYGFYRQIAARHGLDLLDWPTLAFLSVCQYMSTLVADSQLIPGARPLQMERLTAERDYFAESVRALMRDAAAIDDDYLDGAFELGHVNRHRDSAEGDAVTTPEGQFEAWAPWQREAFLYFFGKYQVGAAYAPLGYDVALCKQAA